MDSWLLPEVAQLLSLSLLFQLFLLLLYHDWRPSWAADLSPLPLPDLQIRFPQDGAGGRGKRQIQTKFNRKTPDLDVQQGCEITGYQTQEREICEEIVERICLVRELNNFTPVVRDDKKVDLDRTPCPSVQPPCSEEEL